jgi:hypothetical protein
MNPQARYRLRSLADYRAYFETIVAEATFLDGFYITPEDFLDRAKTDRGGTAFVLENYENNISTNQAENMIGTRTGEFYIVKKSVANSDIQTIREECELLCYKVIGRMKRDRREGILETNINNYNGMEMGVLTANRYTGYGFRFDFVAPVNGYTALIEEDWTEII